MSALRYARRRLLQPLVWLVAGMCATTPLLSLVHVANEAHSVCPEHPNAVHDFETAQSLPEAREATAALRALPEQHHVAPKHADHCDVVGAHEKPCDRLNLPEPIKAARPVNADDSIPSL